MAQGAWMELFASDGHKFDAYIRGPGDRPKGGLVVIQEIFGVNEHIQDVCEGFAADGFFCVAPQMFDRVERKVNLGYDADGIEKGKALKAQIKTEDALLDLKAALDVAQSAGKVATIGYCWGGFLSMAAAQHLPLAGAVVYYGGGIPTLGDDPIQCPVLGHFGELDKGIPMDQVAEIRKLHPTAEIHAYPADHGFNCDRRGSYEATSAKIARERSIDFLDRMLG
ncbi:MAG: dienelactone hydrolase family protein [Alphaproteobacteria bacterium]|nr:dienelactone hydrolase family protein [Alphaproteobacteria bacterium]